MTFEILVGKVDLKEVDFYCFLFSSLLGVVVTDIC